MKLTVAFSCLIVICVVNQAVGWGWGGGGSSSRGSSSVSRSSSSRSGWGWRRGSSSRPATRTNTSRRSWWRTPRKTVANKISPKPKPAPKTSSRWWRTPKKTVPNMKAVIEKYEGKPRLKAYDAQPKNKNYHDTTIGIGFNLNRPDAKKTFEKVLPGVDFNKVKQGKQKITETQARKLFNNDVDNIYVPRAKNKIGTKTYENLPSNVKTAVVNAVYRGDLGPKTSKLIKEGKWDKVKNEYLDHKQYKNADSLGIPGIKTRMDWNAKQFDSMIKPKN